MHFAREEVTNNAVEYEGLLAGLRIAAELGIKKLIVRGDYTSCGETSQEGLPKSIDGGIRRGSREIRGEL